MRSLLVYVSGHGFGHAVRVCTVLRAFRRLRPDVPLVLRTPVPLWFLRAELGEPFASAAVALDVGVVQHDSLSLDPEATLVAATAFLARAPEVVAAEVAAVAHLRPAAVLADIPALAFDVAAELDVPGIGMANFSWDWIYADYARNLPGFRDAIGALRASYARATLLLRLPWHGDLAAFPRIRDLPAVARHATVPRAEVRRRLGLPHHDRIVLLSFGGIGLDLARVVERRGVTYLATQSAAGSAPPCPYVSNAQMAAAGLRYEDLVAAVDAVITKPGYGIVADCIASGTPMVYTDRGRFAEYPVLVDAIRRHLQHAFVSNADLRAGRWEAALDRAWNSSPPAPGADVSGAAHAARLLASYVCEGNGG